MPENDFLAALAAAAPSQVPGVSGEAKASPAPPAPAPAPGGAASAPPSQQDPSCLPTQASDWVPTSQAVLEVAHPVATAYAEACDGRGLPPHAGLLRALASIPAGLLAPAGAAPPPCPPYGAALALALPRPAGGEHEDGGQAGAVLTALLGG